MPKSLGAGSSEAALSLLLRLLEAPQASLAAGGGAQAPTVVKALTQAGFLQDAGLDLSAAAESEDGEEPVSLSWCAEHGGYGYYTAAHGWVAVPHDALRVRTLDLECVISSLSARLYRPHGSRRQELLEGLLWDLGEARLPGRNTGVSIWFARRLFDPPTWRAVRERARARQAPGGRVILTSTPAGYLMDAEVGGAHVVAIEDTLARRWAPVVDPGALVARLDGVHSPVPDGLPILLAGARQVRFRGRTYNFPKGDTQRRIINLLHERARNGERSVSSADVIAELDLPENTRIRDIFKRNPAWGELLCERGGACSFCWGDPETS